MTSPGHARRLAAPVLALALALALVATLAPAGPGGAQTGAADPGRRAAPPIGTPPTELLPGDDSPFVPLKDQAQVVVSQWGLRFKAGQQNSRLTISMVGQRIRFADAGSRSWFSLAKGCVRQQVAQGVAALCRRPAAFRNRRTMFVEVWPRLGNDRVDARRMPAEYRLWVLADAGNDVVQLGAGDDFVNGAFGNDRIDGGAGDDNLRAGKGRDVVDGGDGNDTILGLEGPDRLSGGNGTDTVFGGDGDDRLVGGPGADLLNCGAGRDSVVVSGADQVRECENRTRA